MTSMTSPQHTDRGGTDEIPGPRGGQGVRLLVLGNDSDAQQLRDRAAAAGYELAQRYSARVSHVAYGTGVDPEDVRYAKIREAGLPLLPLQACASELGLRGGAARAGKTKGKAGKAGERPAETAETAGTTETAAEAGTVEPTAEAEAEAVEKVELLETVAAEPEIESEEPELAGEALAFLPLAAAVIGVDPWEGERQAPEYVLHETEPGTEPEADEKTETATDAAAEPAAAPVVWSVAGTGTGSVAANRSSLGRIVTSILWALIPFATFGLLSPITFGYAAYRLRSRGLALTTLVYTLAVMLAFVLSAVRPHASAPSDAAGALLTVCLAGTWIGGTLHAFSLRARVFARS
jgi:hypothetical protein